MRKLKLFFTCLLMVSVSFVYAQTKTASGTVISAEDGGPVVGASVIVKGQTGIGVVTDANGKYSLSVPTSAQTLVISLVGMKTIEVPALPNQQVSMEADVSELDELIISVPYGVAKKSSFSGAASTIQGEKLGKLQTSNISKSLEGAVAGLQTTSGSGQPGAGASIIIRGLGSISASRAPLIILDGVPYEGSLNSISTQDIESYTVLKDAAANSMYGARGSNGVIIITTKRGKTDKTSINFEARGGLNSRGVPAYDVITDPKDYYEMYWESLRNKYVEDGSSYLQAGTAASAALINDLKYNIYKDVPNEFLIDPITGKLNPLATQKKWTDSWLTDPFRNGLRQEYNINVSQAADKSNIYASLSYLNDKGYVQNSDFQRLSSMLKAEQKLGNFIKINGTLSYTNAVTNNVAASNNNYSNIFMFGQAIAPIFPIYLYDQNGNPLLDNKGNKRYDFGTEYARPYASEQNPLSTLNANINKLIADVFTARGAVEFTFLKDFKFTVNAAYDVFNSVTTEFMTPIGGDAANVGGRGYKTSNRYNALNVNQLLNYNKTFNLHSFDVLLGHETKQDNSNSLYGHMTNFVDPTNPEFSNAARYQNLTSSVESYALEGYFGRLDYNFDEKYYATASLRTDGSSRFHPDTRWGQFWALGASWRISKEDFFQGIDFINELKLKASYGTQGNDNIGYWYAYKNLYSVGRIDGEPSTSLAFRGNPDLTWEKSANFNAGFELEAWNNRLSLGFDFFIKQTNDLLYAKPLAVSEGQPSTIFVNDLDMKNTGIELEVGVDIFKTRDFTWNVNLNATHYKNELTRLPADKAELVAKNGGYQAGGYWRKIGGSIYDYYTYEFAGVDQETGRSLYNVYDKERDENGVLTGYVKRDPTVKSGDATLMETGKSPIPDLYGGIGTTLQFRSIDFSMQTAYQLGGYVMDGVYQGFMNPGRRGNNFHKDLFKRWTPENPERDVPKLYFENQDQNASSDRWLTSASYFSIRNLTVGYTLPKNILRQINLEKLRVYGVVDNLWYTSVRKGLDVRQSFSGGVSYAYSPIRTTSIGIQISL